jgi:hypothetical protein
MSVLSVQDELITKHEASCILYTFDFLYKYGVSDAKESHDEMLCNELIGKTVTPGTYGRVSDNEFKNGSEWLLTIAYLLRGNRNLTTMRKFMNRITRNNFLGCFLPLSQDFYNMGMKSFWTYPKSSYIDVFMSQPFMRWGDKLKNIKRDEIIEDMQMMCYDRAKTDQDNLNKYSKSASRYALFQKCMYFAIKGNKKWIETL